MLLVAVSASVLVLSACGSGGGKKPVYVDPSNPSDLYKKAGSEIAERMIGEGDYYVDIDLEAQEGGEGISWPGNIPNEYPRFQSGKIEVIMGDILSEDEIVLLQYIEIEEDEIEKYFKELEGLGWKVEETEMEGIILGYIATKGNLKISVDIDPTGPGTAFLYLEK